ncbi:hypothetical protein D3C72_936340 [compost metagenome]
MLWNFGHTFIQFRIFSRFFQTNQNKLTILLHEPLIFYSECSQILIQIPGQLMFVDLFNTLIVGEPLN